MKNYTITLIASLFGIVFGIFLEPIVENVIIISDENKKSEIYMEISMIAQVVFLFFIFFVIIYFLHTFRRYEKKNEKTTELIMNKLGSSVSYFSVGKKKDKFYDTVGSIIENSEEELLIISSHYIQIDSMPNEISKSFSRKKYYEILNKKIDKNSNYKFKRIIQVPDKSDIFSIDDDMYLDHLNNLSCNNETCPDIRFLKKSPVFSHSTYFLIDRRILLWQIIASDPANGNMYTMGYFLFENMNKKFLNEFLSFFYKVDAHSKLIGKKK